MNARTTFTSLRHNRAMHVLALVCANALALWMLVSPGVSEAQPAVRPADARARGDYTMVAGRTSQGGTQQVVYVVDSANQEVVALRWDQTKRLFTGVGYRSLGGDARGLRGR